MMQLTKLMDDKEIGIRGYLLSLDFAFLKRYSDADWHLPGLRKELDRLIAGTRRKRSSTPS
jgi:CHASE3 domain sensor protein